MPNAGAAAPPHWERRMQKTHEEQAQEGEAEVEGLVWIDEALLVFGAGQWEMEALALEEQHWARGWMLAVWDRGCGICGRALRSWCGCLGGLWGAVE